MYDAMMTIRYFAGTGLDLYDSNVYIADQVCAAYLELLRQQRRHRKLDRIMHGRMGLVVQEDYAPAATRVKRSMRLRRTSSFPTGYGWATAHQCS